MSDASGTLSGQLTQTETPSSATGSQSPTLEHPARGGLAVLGFALPVCAYFWFIYHYGTNMLWLDQWDDINIISQAKAHLQLM